MNRPGMYLDIVPAAPVSCARCGEAVAKGTGGYAVAAGMHGMFDPLPSLIRRLCHACFQAEKLEAECREAVRVPHDDCPQCADLRTTAVVTTPVSPPPDARCDMCGWSLGEAGGHRGRDRVSGPLVQSTWICASCARRRR